MSLPEPIIRRPGVWACLPSALEGLARAPGNPTQQIGEGFAAAGRGRGAERLIERVGSVAIVQVVGTLVKSPNWYEEYLGAVDSRAVRGAVRSAAADPSVSAIVLLIDSPGGTTTGTQDLADDVAAARRAKPTVAYIEDLGASAAYWVASQASKIYAGSSAVVGSIGTYLVIEDVSGMAGQLGVKIHVVKAGEYKGAGVTGTEVTPEQLAEFQRVVNAVNDQFLKGVANGRRMALSKVRALADGRVHVGAAAQDLGLIDGIKSLDDVVRDLAGGTTSKQTRPGDRQALSTSSSLMEKPTMALTPTEIRAACPGASDSFILRAIESGKTIADIQQEHMQALSSENAELRRSQRVASKAPLGITLSAEGDAGRVAGDAIAEWDQRLRQLMATGMDKRRAVRTLVKQDRSLYEEYLRQYNEQRGRPYEPRR